MKSKTKEQSNKDDKPNKTDLKLKKPTRLVSIKEAEHLFNLSNVKTEEPIPEDVLENLCLLREDLEENIPSRKRLDDNLLIATWNIRGFGNLNRKWKFEEKDSPKRDLHSLLCIVEILKRFDVIAIQEVKANIRALRDALKLLGDNWSMILTDVNKGSAGNGERMAYLFDTRRVKLSGLAGEIVIPKEWEKKISEESLAERFVRSPYAVSFRANHQTFILVTLHILYGKNAKERVPEINAIAQWMSEWATDVNAYHQNMIVLGDFNIERRDDDLNNAFLKKGLYVPDVLSSKDVLRSIFNETKYYDQIAWFNGEGKEPKLSMKFNNGGYYNFVDIALANRGLTDKTLSYVISDHYPLWAEFKLY